MTEADRPLPGVPPMTEPLYYLLRVWYQTPTGRITGGAVRHATRADAEASLARLRGNPQCVGWTLTEVRHSVVSEQIPPDRDAGQ